MRSLWLSTTTRRVTPASSDRWPKGRGAPALAVPPFLRIGRRCASLGCLVRGRHPPGPTCDAEQVSRLSSVRRSRARSAQLCHSRALTIPESLRHAVRVLIPVSAGKCAKLGAANEKIDCSWNSRWRRPSARRLTRWSPERRAGGAPHKCDCVHCVTSSPPFDAEASCQAATNKTP